MTETTNKTSQGSSRGPRTGGSRGPRTGGPRGPRREGGARFERAKPEYDQKILAIRRVTRVVSGGRRMTFSVALAIGDRKGMVGLGTGKGVDTALAIAKAQKSAKKNMLKLKLTKTGSIPHEIKAKFGSASLMIMPNRTRGIIAGSAVRDMLLLAGVKDVSSKIFSGTKNKLNIARATMKALGTVGTKVMRYSPEERGAQKTDETKSEEK